MTDLADLARWYAAQCDGAWEHHHAVSLTSLDNPGWWLKVDLTGTALAGRAFAAVADNVDPEGHPQGPRWLHCRLQGDTWHGAGDETRLAEIVRRFLDWA